MAHEAFDSVMDRFTRRRKQGRARSRFFERHELSASWRAAEGWREVNSHDFMHAATIYNPDNPYDVIEVNPHGDPSTHPLKSFVPNDSQKVVIRRKIDSLQDLLDIIDENPVFTNIEYNIDVVSLHKIRPALKKLNAMIGMQSLKENIVDQLLYYIQELHKNKGSTTDFMHTVLYGPPGTGKTEIAQIIGEIFSKLAILEKGTFRKAMRSDLVAGYLGQTAIKTREVIDSCLGGVLFIDEAYALGSRDKKDSYSKECLDTLCEALSAHKESLMVIVAGYEDQLQECFFAANQGLDSRFCWRFHTDRYSADELMQIFTKKVSEIGWDIDADCLENSGFRKNVDKFTSYGRDMELLLSKVKICHGRRVFTLPRAEKMRIALEDVNNGIEMFLKHRKRLEDPGDFPGMYT